MKVTIIPSDTYCSVDGVGYDHVDMSTVPEDVHAVQYDFDSGWIEFVSFGETHRPNEPITNLDQFQAVLDSWNEIDYLVKHPPAPPPPNAHINQMYAQDGLEETDWTQIPSVSDPALSNPYLTNAAEFAEYRNFLRQYAINPVSGFIDWPTQPQAIWENVV